MHGDKKMTDEDLKRATYLAAKNFFGWNSGKNTPNILLMLSDQIGGLRQTIDQSSKSTAEQIGELKNTIGESSRSSSALASALNRITFWYAIITAVGVLCTATQVYLALRESRTPEPKPITATPPPAQAPHRP
jgi:hypothetical protein